METQLDQSPDGHREALLGRERGPGEAVVLGRHVAGRARPALSRVHPLSPISLRRGLLHTAPSLPSRLPGGGTIARLTSGSLGVSLCPVQRLAAVTWGDSAVSGWECGLRGRILTSPLPGCQASGGLRPLCLHSSLQRSTSHFKVVLGVVPWRQRALHNTRVRAPLWGTRPALSLAEWKGPVDTSPALVKLLNTVVGGSRYTHRE